MHRMCYTFMMIHTTNHRNRNFATRCSCAFQYQVIYFLYGQFCGLRYIPILSMDVGATSIHALSEMIIFFWICPKRQCPIIAYDQIHESIESIESRTYMATLKMNALEMDNFSKLRAKYNNANHKFTVADCRSKLIRSQWYWQRCHANFLSGIVVVACRIP